MIAGIVAILTEILYGYVVFKYGLLPPAQQPAGIAITLGVVVISALLYYVAYYCAQTRRD